MKSILRSIIVEKYDLKNGDKISYEKLVEIEQNENVKLEDLIIVLGIKRSNYIRIRWDRKSSTHILLNENKITKEERKKERLILNSLNTYGRVILRDILNLRNKLNISDEEICNVLQISKAQIRKLETGQIKKLKTNERIRIQVKLLRIDLTYIYKFKNKVYTKSEVKDLCKQYQVTIKDFCRYINDKPKEYKENLLILNKNANGMYIGDKFKSSNEFIEKNYRLLDNVFNRMAIRLSINQSRKDDLKSAAYEMLIKEGGDIEKNYEFDNELMLTQCKRLAKKAMIIEKYNMPKEKALILRNKLDVEFSYLDIIGSEKYNPYKMIDNIEQDDVCIYIGNERIRKW